MNKNFITENESAEKYLTFVFYYNIIYLEPFGQGDKPAISSTRSNGDIIEEVL